MFVIGRNDKGMPVGVADARKLLEDLPNKIRDVLGVMADVSLVKKSERNSSRSTSIRTRRLSATRANTSTVAAARRRNSKVRPLNGS